MSRTVAAALVVALAGVMPSLAQHGKDLMSSTAGQPVLSPAGEVARFITIDRSLLRDGAASLRLELPDGPVELAELDRFESRGPGDTTWRGRVLFEPDSRVVLTLKNGLVSGSIRSSLGVYELRPGRGGGQVIERIDPDRFPACGGSRDADPLATLADFSRASAPATSLSNDPASQIELLSLYTPQARDGAGGTAQIEALIQSAVDLANTAFEDSGMSARFVLVHTAEAAYNDSGNMDADLSWVQSDPGVRALRDQHAADMVSLIVNQGAYCGVGYVMRDPGASFADWAFQVTHRMCAVSNLSFAHEHGHNLGFEHDPANGTRPNNASYEWSFGHFVNGSYRTVMAYSSECSLGCSRVARFSNPALAFNGFPTGVAGERDNAQSGEATAAVAANFRNSAVCGNGIVEGSEECDGSVPQGASCDAVGCSAGTPSCTASCTLDYSSCSSCGACDFDGVCETGEDCGNCPSDCVSGSAATCGDGVCDVADGEDCVSCPQDCAGRTGGKPSGRFCCGDGDGPNPISCGDARCSTGGFQCSVAPAAASCCGDGACGGAEDGFSCSLDCGPPPTCGDGFCDASESSCTCPLDCGGPTSDESLSCGDGADNDCDGAFDCNDLDCAEDLACAPVCEPLGSSCSSNSDCCEGRCRGTKGQKSCQL